MDEDLMTMNVPVVEQLLAERNWNWADLARAMEMSKSTINRVVRRETRPGRKFIFALMKVFRGRSDLFIVVPRDQAAPVEEDEPEAEAA